MKKLLIELCACDEAMKWANGKSWKEIFDTCHRGDWLLWLFYHTKTDSENDFALLTIAKGYCANSIRHLMKDHRSIDAVDAAINYSGDRVALKAAADSAKDAASASADAAYAAASADVNAAYAAGAYSAYAAGAAYADAKRQNQQHTADIVRLYIPIEKWRIDTNLNWE